ncbi:hypothetical protein AVEN_96568-1 [Araneus ventricosus]|uniref:Mos1 transposase HTH domain-containing protein n=1 Tax=Araneus ventricosus TaxID=182803 RepID=A0A4Y2H8E1_ARAVE|nr:hypothetical protein AVEN_96568-1 [Araneus ventricosus]
MPEFSLVQISIADRRVLKTWSQMEVRAVMRYEWARGISILDTQRRLESAIGDDIMSCQMAVRSCPMFSEGRLSVEDAEGYGRPSTSTSVGVIGYLKYYLKYFPVYLLDTYSLKK